MGSGDCRDIENDLPMRSVRVVRLFNLFIVLSLRLDEFFTTLFQRLAVTARDRIAVRVVGRHRRGFVGSRRWSRSIPSRSSGRSSAVVVGDVRRTIVVGFPSTLALNQGSRLRHRLTHRVADQGTSSNTTDSDGSELSVGMTLVFALVLVFLVFLDDAVRVVAVGASGTVALVIALSVAEERSLVMCAVCPSRRSIGTLWRRRSSRRVPLSSSCRLVYVVPALAALVPLSKPPWRHWRWRTVL